VVVALGQLTRQTAYKLRRNTVGAWGMGMASYVIAGPTNVLFCAEDVSVGLLVVSMVLR
jgi:hypothetical protein